MSTEANNDDVVVGDDKIDSNVSGQDVIQNNDDEGIVLLPSQLAKLDVDYADELAIDGEEEEELEEEEPWGEWHDHPKIPNNYIMIYLHPHLAPPSDWAMADPWPIWIPADYNQFDIARLIERLKGIPAHRQAYRFKDGETLNIKQEKWAMKRLGIRDNYVIRLEPTLPNSWTWYPKEHYIRKFIEDLKIVIADNNGFVKLSDALNKVLLPPIIQTSARVLLRQYPELIHVHIDTTYNEAWIMEKKFDRQTPTFSNMPITLGYTPRIQLPTFSWSEYLDIDDTKPLVLDFPIPDVFFKCIIKKATGLKPIDTFANSSNTYAVFYFNDKKVGQTSYKLLNVNPSWNDAIFDLTCSAEIETKRCVIYIEFFHKSLIEEFEDTFIGSLNLTGQAIEDLLGSGNSSIMELPLQSNKKGDTSNDSEASGTITLCGGRKGMELTIFSARELTPITNPESHPLAIVFYNGVELLQTLPNRANRHPVWNETLCIPDISSSQSLDQVILEIQIWNTSTAKGVPFGTKEDFMGTSIITGEKLVSLFDKNNKYATTLTAPLTQSKTVPFKQRTRAVAGFVNIIAGPVGSPMNYGKYIELTISQVKGIAKVKEFFYVIIWNNIQEFKSELLALETLNYKDENKKDKQVTIKEIEEKILLGTRWEARNCMNHSLLIEFFEYDAKQDAGNYLGNITLKDKELSNFFDNSVLQETKFDMGRDITWDDKYQRLVRGEVTLRAGPKDARFENQRLLVINNCTNLLGVKPNGLSNPFVTITWNKVEVAKTYTVNENLDPKWKDQLFTLTCPETPDKKNPQYNGTSSGCTLYIEVWDEVVGGLLGGGPKKGVYLGGIYLEYDEVAELLEQRDYKEHEFKLQVGPLDKRKGIPKPIRGGKVGTEGTIKIICPGLKYPSWTGVLEERESLLNGNDVVDFDEDMIDDGAAESIDESSVIEGSIQEESVQEGSIENEENDG